MVSFSRGDVAPSNSDWQSLHDKLQDVIGQMSSVYEREVSALRQTILTMRESRQQPGVSTNDDTITLSTVAQTPRLSGDGKSEELDGFENHDAPSAISPRSWKRQSSEGSIASSASGRTSQGTRTRRFLPALQIDPVASVYSASSVEEEMYEEAKDMQEDIGSLTHVEKCQLKIVPSENEEHDKRDAIKGESAQGRALKASKISKLEDLSTTGKRDAPDVTKQAWSHDHSGQVRAPRACTLQLPGNSSTAPDDSEGRGPPQRKPSKLSQASSSFGDNSQGKHGKLELSINPDWIAASVIVGASADAVLRARGKAAEAREENGEHCGQLSKKLVIHPSSKGRALWDFFGILFLTYDLVLIPLQAFQEFISSDSFWVKDVGYISSAYWGLDMIASFFLGYHANGFLELRLLKITKHYLRTWFAFDFMLVVVDTFFIITGTGGQSASPFRIGKAFSRGARALRILRVVKMQGLVTGLLEAIRSDYTRTVLEIFGIILVIIAANHFIACGWYGLSFASETNWRQTAFVEDMHDDFGYRYVTCLHWSLTQFTPANMEVFPRNKWERAYAVLTLLFALVTFSSFVSSVTQSMTHLRELNAQKVQGDNLLRRYLHERNISADLINRVWHHLHQHNMRTRRTSLAKASQIESLMYLPSAMKRELSWETFGPVLNKHPFFEQLGINFQETLTAICFEVVSDVSLIARQELFPSKTDELNMFFVIQGVLEYALPCRCAVVLEDDLELEGEAQTKPRQFFKSVISLGNLRSSRQDDKDVQGQRGHNFKEPKKLQELAAIGHGSATAACHRYSDLVHVDQWACEAALWATDARTCGPFTALVQSEILLVSSQAFQKLIMNHDDHMKKRVAKYGVSFVEAMELLTNCKWRMVIANDYSIIQDLAHRAFDYHGDQGDQGRNSRISASGFALRSSRMQRVRGRLTRVSRFNW